VLSCGGFLFVGRKNGKTAKADTKFPYCPAVPPAPSPPVGAFILEPPWLPLKPLLPWEPWLPLVLFCNS